VLKLGYIQIANLRVRKGGKWELGFAYFWTGKIGFGLLGMGTTDTKMGNPYAIIKTVAVGHKFK
jgi:hypothetical protein